MGPKTEIHSYTWTNTNCLQFLSCCKIMRKLTAFVNTHTRTHKQIHACMHAYLHTYIHTYIHTCIQMGNKCRLENPTNIRLVELIKISFYILCSFINPFTAHIQIALPSQDEPDISLHNYMLCDILTCNVYIWQTLKIQSKCHLLAT